MKYEPPTLEVLGTIETLTQVSEPYLRRGDSPWITDLNPGMTFMAHYTTMPGIVSSVTE